jgi:tRNA A-37 threonylcarbamoyl transferase component Bud32
VLRGGDWAAEAMRQLPAAADSWLRQEGRVLKADRHSVVSLVQLQGETCYVKSYAAKNVLQQGIFALGRGRATDAYDAAVALTDAGVAVPAAKACLLLEGSMLLVAQGLPAAQDLKAIWTQAPAPIRPQELLQTAGETLAALHGAGFAHGDCKWSNLLWDQNQFYLVDLEAVARCPLQHRKQARDLARFTVNAEDLGVEAEQYGHFLDGYCTRLNLGRGSVMDSMRGDLVRFRARHRDKYGERGARLI